MKRTKIIATLGPASNKKEVLSQLLQDGVDVIRLNGSHYRDNQSVESDIKLIRVVSKSIQKPVGIFFDLQGPKIRVATFKKNGVILKTGQAFTIKNDPGLIGTHEMCTLTTPHIINDLQIGDTIFIDDGNIRLEITSKSAKSVVCNVLQGGKVSNHKGVNLPKSTISVSAITEKDMHDVKVAVQNGVDYIALSFVSHPEDVRQLRQIMTTVGDSSIGIISKIERHSAIEHLSEIIDESDAIMVARGDLGVEIGLEKVPEVQKMIIRECNKRITPVIVATQMLESMVTKPTATRAEVSDVANAICDRCDAVMLSAETAVGEFPIEVVQTMRKICEESDDYVSELKSSRYAQVKRVFETKTHATTFCKAADQISEEISATIMVAFTSSGTTPLTSSKLNPSIPILAPSDNERIIQKMTLLRAVIPLKMKQPFSSIESWGEMIRIALDDAKNLAIVEPGDIAVVTAGYPIGHSGGTNSIRMIVVR